MAVNFNQLQLGTVQLPHLLFLSQGRQLCMWCWNSLQDPGWVLRTALWWRSMSVWCLWSRKCRHRGGPPLWHQHSSLVQASFTLARATFRGFDELTLSFCYALSLFVFLFFLIKLLKKILSFDNREREREINLLSHLFYAFIGYFLYVPWLRIEPTTLAYQDIALTNWTNWMVIFKKQKSQKEWLTFPLTA